MRLVVASLMLLSFVTIAVFGFFWIGCDMGACGRLCLAKVSKLVACPADGAHGTAMVHTQAFMKFSQAILSSVIAIAIIAMLAVLFTINSGSAFELAKFSSFPLESASQGFLSRPGHAKWFALHEKRDPALAS